MVFRLWYTIIYKTSSTLISQTPLYRQVVVIYAGLQEHIYVGFGLPPGKFLDMLFSFSRFFSHIPLVKVNLATQLCLLTTILIDQASKIGFFVLSVEFSLPPYMPPLLHCGVRRYCYYLCPLNIQTCFKSN